MGLVLERLEGDIEHRYLVLTVHHCYLQSMMNSPAFKLIENHMDEAMIKQGAVERG